MVNEVARPGAWVALLLAQTQTNSPKQVRDVISSATAWHLFTFRRRFPMRLMTSQTGRRFLLTAVFACDRFVVFESRFDAINLNSCDFASTINISHSIINKYRLSIGEKRQRQVIHLYTRVSYICRYVHIEEIRATANKSSFSSAHTVCSLSHGKKARIQWHTILNHGTGLYTKIQWCTRCTTFYKGCNEPQS